MKSSSLLRSLFVTSLAYGFSWVSTLSAATYYWDADVNTAKNQNGSGVWGSGNNWTATNSEENPANSIFVQGAGHVAAFGSTSGYTNNYIGGTVTLAGTVSIARIDKSSLAGEYIITAGAEDYAIRLSRGTGPSTTVGIGNNSTSATLIIDARVEGTEGLLKFNSGTVVLARDNAWTGGTRIQTVGSASVPTSILQIGNGGTSGTLGTGDVQFQSDGTNTSQSVLAFNRSDRVVLTQKLISHSAGANKGILRQMGTGTLVLNSDLSDFTGVLEVMNGVMTLGEANTVGDLGETSSIAVNGSGIFAVNRSDDFIFSTRITGNGIFEKRGDNTLTIQAPTTQSTHTGRFSMAGGSVVLGTSEVLSQQSTLFFSEDSNFDLNGKTQTFKSVDLAANVTGKVIGSSDSHLIVKGDHWIIGIKEANQTQTLDFTALEKLSYDAAAYDLRWGTIGNAINNRLEIKLAKENYFTTKHFGLAIVESADTFGPNRINLDLGLLNEIQATTLTIGATKSDVSVKFGSGEDSNTLKIRGLDGVSRADSMIIGRGESGGLVTTATFDLRGGTSDLYLNTLSIGRNHNRETQDKNTTGTFIMGAGLIDANKIVLGEISNTSTNTVYRAIGNLELVEGGTIQAAQIIFGDKTGTGAGGATGSLKLTDGTLKASSIRHGNVSSITSELIWSQGLLTHLTPSSDLQIDDITIRLNGNGERTLQIDANRVVTINSNIVNGATTPNIAFTKSGIGTLVLGGTHTQTGRIVSEGGIVRTTKDEVLSGGFQFAGNGTLDLQNFNETIANLAVDGGVSAKIIAGKLVVNATTDFVMAGTVDQAFTYLDLSDVGEFEWNGATRKLSWGSQLNRINNRLEVDLADKNKIVAKKIGFAIETHGDTYGQNRAIIRLGADNTFFADDLEIGKYKSNTKLSFAPDVTDGIFVYRATAGGTSRGNWMIGQTQSSSVTTEAVVDFSGGTLDARVNKLILGRSDNNNAQLAKSTSSILMTKGILDVTEMVLGELNQNSSSTAVFVDSKFTLNGTGEVKVENLNFSTKTSGGAASNGAIVAVFEVNGGGTLAVKNINKGTATSTQSDLLWKNGTVKNYDDSSDLVVSGIQVKLDGNATRSFEITGSRKGTVYSSVVNGANPVSGIAFDKIGTGRLDLMEANTYSGTTRVSNGALYVHNTSSSGTGTGSVEVLAAATLGGTGIIKPTGSAGIFNHGTLRAGMTEATVASSLQIDLSLTTGSFSSDGILAFDLFTNAGDNTSLTQSSDRLQILGNSPENVFLSGSILLGIDPSSDLVATSFQAGDRWLLVDWDDDANMAQSVNLSGINFTGGSLSSGLNFEIQTASTGLYAVVVAIPEPSKAVLVVIGLFIVGFRRKR